MSHGLGVGFGGEAPKSVTYYLNDPEPLHERFPRSRISFGFNLSSAYSKDYTHAQNVLKHDYPESVLRLPKKIKSYFIQIFLM